MTRALVLSLHCSNVAGRNFDGLLVLSLGIKLQNVGVLLENRDSARLKVVDVTSLKHLISVLTLHHALAP